MSDSVYFKNTQDLIKWIVGPPRPRLKKGELWTLSSEEVNKVSTRIDQLEEVELAARVLLIVNDAGSGTSVEDLEKLQAALGNLSEALKKVDHFEEDLCGKEIKKTPYYPPTKIGKELRNRQEQVVSGLAALRDVGKLSEEQ